MTRWRIGIDLGGTKIEAVVVPERFRDASEVRWRERVATPQGEYEGTIAAIAGLAIGSWRIEAIAGQALRGSPGEELSVTCVLLEAPRRL